MRAPPWLWQVSSERSDPQRRAERVRCCLVGTPRRIGAARMNNLGRSPAICALSWRSQKSSRHRHAGAADRRPLLRWKRVPSIALLFSSARSASHTNRVSNASFSAFVIQLKAPEFVSLSLKSRGCQMWLSNGLGAAKVVKKPFIYLVIPAGVEPAFPT